MGYYEKVTKFYEQYADVDPKAYNLDGILKFNVIRQINILLLDEKIFTTKRAIKQQALRQYGIILRYEYFD